MIAFFPVLAPPPVYDHPPERPAIIMPVDDTIAACRNLGAVVDAYGCATDIGGTCYVIIGRDGPRDWRWGLLHHELAHCNGWRHPTP